MSTLLGERSIQVLTTIIEEYITTAVPVGSKVVAENSRLKLSSASMRNTMSDLTELGFLEQPHTSAGRVPTNKAFRLYIDRLLELRPLPEAEKERIIQALDQNDLEITEILRRATGLVAACCNQVSMVLAPERKSARWNSIGFSQAGPGKILIILVLEGGMVETRVIDNQNFSMPTPFTTDELTRFGNYLNSNFRGMTLYAAREAIKKELSFASQHLEKMFCQALTLGVLAVQHVSSDRELFVDGTKAILEQAEFSDISSAREMFAFLEERTRLLELLDATMDRGGDRSGERGVKSVNLKEDVQVSFWQGNSVLPGCSMVSSSYGDVESGKDISNLGGLSGVVSVIGPSRMNYSAVLPVVGYISQTLTGILQARAFSS